MRTAAVIAAALVALVAWYLLRGDGAAPQAAPARRAVVAAPPSTTPPTLTTAEQDDPLAIVDATHTAMQELGRQCFANRTLRTVAPGQPDDTVGRLELRLGIRITNGTARVEAANVVSTRRLRDDVRDCIVTASRASSWPVAAPDGSHEITELFRMGDYVAVPRPDSPPSAPPTR